MMSNLRATVARLMHRKRAYHRALFGDDGELNENGKIIMADLKKFCRGGQSTTMVSPISRTVDPLASAQAEGRREVYDRIVQMLHLPDRVLAELDDEGQ